MGFNYICQIVEFLQVNFELGRLIRGYKYDVYYLLVVFKNKKKKIISEFIVCKDN